MMKLCFVIVSLVLVLAVTDATPLSADENYASIEVPQATNTSHVLFHSSHRACLHKHRHLHHPRRRCACERYKHLISHEDVRKRSLCRWIYEVDYDETRKPACIPKVVGCINTVQNEAVNDCEMVKIPFPVRRKSGSKLWNDEWIELPVACTLVRPHIHHVSITDPPSLPFTVIN